MIDVHRQKFRVLFYTLVVLIAVYPVLRDALETRILFEVVTTAVFVVTVFSVYPRGLPLRVALVLGIPTLVGLWVGYVFPGIPRQGLSVGFHALAAGFLGYTVSRILHVVYREPRVTTDAVYGAFCGYIVVGLTFGHLYCVAEVLGPGSFAGSGDFPGGGLSEDRRHQVLTYFSFITLATVGYGDITPVRGAARGLAIAEAITGQFYIAVLVAELIGKRVGSAPARPDTSP